MKQLNTMETLKNGFKIKRNKTIITLTKEEMARFRYLEKATSGCDCLESYKDLLEEDPKEEEKIILIDKMMKDENICHNIEDDFLEIVYKNTGDLEQEIINKYLDSYMKSL